MAQMDVNDLIADARDDVRFPSPSRSRSRSPPAGGGAGAAVTPDDGTPEKDGPDRDEATFSEATPLGNTYAQNGEVKALGAWWNAATRQWMAPLGATRETFEEWLLLSGPEEYLEVPYAEKDTAKQAVDAQWDQSKKKWYVPKLRLCAHNLNICREKGWLT
jgi:hypothetical protein